MGIGLHEFFARHRPWSQLDNILTRLPQESHYKAALAADDELAELVDLNRKGTADIPLEGYGRLAATLDDIRDEIRMLRTDQANLTPGLPTKAKFKPVPRPRTAVERRAERIRDQQLSSLEKRLMGEP